MNHDLLTRLYLRHYAYLTNRYPHQPPATIFHFATLGVSALLSLALFATLALGFWIASSLLNRPITPWALPGWVIAFGCLVLAFLPGLIVDRKMSPLRVVGQELVEFYSKPEERFRWWLTIFSILPLTCIVAACFVALRSIE
jgi:hypothetical protein